MPSSRQHEKDLAFMRMAYSIADLSTCSRLNVGAVLVKGDNPISVGFNGSARGEAPCDHSQNLEAPCEITLHAEANCLIYCNQPKYLATLYLTHEPCFRCAGYIINSELLRVYYAEFYRSYDGIRRLENAGLPCEQLNP